MGFNSDRHFFLRAGLLTPRKLVAWPNSCMDIKKYLLPTQTLYVISQTHLLPNPCNEEPVFPHYSPWTYGSLPPCHAQPMPRRTDDSSAI